MAKDPAFLFYPGDWLGGTMGMTFEEKGAYFELLMLQFNRGHMTEHMIRQTVGQLWDTIKVKFIKDDDGRWYNERLKSEKEKRQTYVQSRSNNKKGANQHSKKTGHMSSHMEDVNINENKDDKVKEGSGKPLEDHRPVTEVMIAPRIVSIHKRFNPNYLISHLDDMPAATKIAYFIFDQSKVSGEMTDHSDQIAEAWTVISQFISTDKFYCQKGLKTIANHIQELASKSLYGDKSTTLTNGKNTKPSIDGVKAAHDRRYGGGKQA